MQISGRALQILVPVGRRLRDGFMIIAVAAKQYMPLENVYIECPARKHGIMNVCD